MKFKYKISGISWNTKWFDKINTESNVCLPSNYEIVCNTNNINYYYDRDTQTWKIEKDGDVCHDDFGNVYNFKDSDKCKSAIVDLFLEDLEDIAIAAIEEQESFTIDMYEDSVIEIL